LLYALLRATAGVALRWFYSRIDAEGLERVPADAPVLLAVNHPNALVDALVVAWVFPRRIVFTGKATLFANPLLAVFLRAAGVVPLIRSRDVAELQSPADAKRNERAFGALNGALASGRAVLIFPEGITGDHPSLARLRTGVARIALSASDSGVRRLSLVPVGLTFERKDTARTRVHAQVGEPIDVDSWPRTNEATDVAALTAELDRRLRAVTLNFETLDAAARATALASQLAGLLRGESSTPEVSRPHEPLADQVAITRRIEQVRAVLEDANAPDATRRRVNQLLDRLKRFDAERRDHAIAIADLEIDVGKRAGTWFVVRELAVLLLGGPVALWGWLNHWLPFNLAGVVARRSVVSGADPAMRTIVSGIGLVVLFYLAQGSVVYAVLGGLVAALYIVSLPLAAEVNFYLGARLRRALQRARTYLLFRRRRDLQQRLESELQGLRSESQAIDAILAVEGSRR
jgi:glycerol-3-phosphate O-acyltransferase / dihydroxyacetone phosphate acyltransferase